MSLLSMCMRSGAHLEQLKARGLCSAFQCIYVQAQQHFCILLLVDGSPTAGDGTFVVPANGVREQRARRALKELNVMNTDCAPYCDFRCINEERGAQLVDPRARAWL